MTNIQASILYGQLEDVETILDKKKIIFNYYKEKLSDIKKIKFQKICEGTEHSMWMFGIRIDGFTVSQKQKLELFLFESGIDNRPMFYSINNHKHLSKINSVNTNSDLLQSQCIILPSYPDLTKSQVNFICDKIKIFLEKIDI